MKPCKSKIAFCTASFSLLKYKADKSAAAFVDYSLKGFLELHSCVRGHTVQLVVQSLVHKLMQ